MSDQSLPPGTLPALTVERRSRGRPKGSFKNQEPKPPSIQASTGVRPPGTGFGGSPIPRGMSGKNKPWKDALTRAIAQADGKVLRKLADALVKKASAGDVAALKEIGDRLDGKSVQAVEQKMDAVITVRTEDANL